MWIRNLAEGFRNKSSMDYTSLGCCALAFVLYINTLNFGFVYDDRRAILGNTDVAGTTPWQQAFLHDYWGTPLTDTGSHGSYRPLCVLSFKLNYILGGYTPWGYHLINNLMHCLATGLVVKLARNFLSSMWGIVATGALFAAHPVHTEAVAGIVGRADLAACILYLLTYLTYIRHIVWRERNDSRQWLAIVFTVVLSLCALLFKETAITALLVCGIFDVIRGLCGFSDKNRCRSLGILAVALVCTIYVRLQVLPRPQSHFSTADNPIAKSNSVWTRFLTFLYLPVFNFKLLVNPTVLSFDWGMDAVPRITSLWDKRNVLSAGFYTILVLVLWLSTKRLAERQISAGSHRYKRPLLHQQHQYHHHRKSRTKRKYTIINQNSIDGLLPEYNPCVEVSSASALLLKKDCICRVCKQEVTAPRHTSSCRAMNNNNTVLPTGVFSECECPQLLLDRMDMVHQQQQQQQQHSKTDVDAPQNNNCRITPRSSRSSSSCSNSTTASSKSSSSGASSCTVTSSFSVNSNCQSLLISSNPATYNAVVLLMVIAFITLPFLPATNLFFYVGFVVAERLLYLPSVGYCLLVGFGIGKLMEPLRHQRNKRIAVLLCMSLTLSVLSVRTVRRNLDWRDEESLYRSAIGVNPPKALGNLGSVLSSQARYAEAKEVLLEAIKHRPNMADVHFNLGILHQNQQNYKNAVENFQRAIQFRPNLAVAYLNLGTSLIAMGKCHEAVKVLLEGTKTDGTAVRDRVAHENARMSAYLQLGNLYAEQGKMQRALAVYREAMHSLPAYFQREVLYHRIGDVLGRLQQWDEAEKYHRAALRIQPDHVAAHLSYGNMLARNSSRTSEAELWFKRALQLAPDQSGVYHHYAEFLTGLSRGEEALYYRLRAAELSPDDYSLVVAVATALRLLDRKIEAEVWYRKAVMLRPDDARAHTNLGAILHLLGRTKNAAVSYKEALRLQPGDPTTLGNLAKLGITEVK